MSRSKRKIDIDTPEYLELTTSSKRTKVTKEQFVETPYSYLHNLDVINQTINEFRDVEEKREIANDELEKCNKSSSDLIPHQMRVVNLKGLKELNKLSIKLDYNRNIHFTPVFKKLKEEMSKINNEHGVWKGLNTFVLLKPLMFHKHKNGEECETHIRCEVLTNQIIPFLTLDLPVKEVKVLEVG